MNALEASKAESSGRAKLGKPKPPAISPKKSSRKSNVDLDKIASTSPNSTVDSNENGKSSKKKSSSSSSSHERDIPRTSSSSKKTPKKSKSDDSIASSAHSGRSSKSRNSEKRSSRSKSPKKPSRSRSSSTSKKKSERRSAEDSRVVSNEKETLEGKKKRSMSLPKPPRRSDSSDHVIMKKSSAHKRSPTRRLKRHVTDLDQLSLATSLSGDLSRMGRYAKEQEDHSTSLNALVYKLRDSSLEEQLVGLFKRIEAAEGFPKIRRPASDANEIEMDMYNAVRNDPDISSIRVEEDRKFKDVDKSLPLDFAEGLRGNLHLTSLAITGAGLGDDFITAISHSCRYNFTLRTLILSNNCFTSEGLVEFCCCLSANESLRHVDLRDQQNDVSLLQEHEKEAIEAVIVNRHIRVLQMHVSTEKAMNMIQMVQDRNMKQPKSIEYDKKLLKHLEAEAVNAEQLVQLNLLEEKLKHNFQKDWTLLCNLAEIAQINKAEVSGAADRKKSCSPGNNLLPPKDEMTDDGAFLDADFISKFLEEDPSSLGLMFNFKDQSSLFKAFPDSHPARQDIVNKFVDILLEHKKSKDITRLIMKGSGCGDDFVIALCSKCMGNSKVLPKCFLVDLSKNCVSDSGLDALSECITDKKGLRYLQVLKLQDQYFGAVDSAKRIYFSMDSEFKLTKALCQNLTVLRLVLKILSVAERKKIEGYLSRNLDLIQQARQMKGELSKNITHVRNDLEQEIDKLAENDPAVWLFDKSENQLFLSLKRKDVLKLAKGLGTNKFVTEVRLDRLELDDEFAVLLGESLQSNGAIRVLSLEGNAIGGDGIKAILTGLANNKTLADVRLRDQTQSMSPEDEKSILDLLGDNETIKKLAIDVSSEDVQEQIAMRLYKNQQSQWKLPRRN